jgi:hypothetical protein
VVQAIHELCHLENACEGAARGCQCVAAIYTTPLLGIQPRRAALNVTSRSPIESSAKKRAALSRGRLVCVLDSEAGDPSVDQGAASIDFD